MLRDDALQLYKQAHPSSMSTSGTALPALRGTYLEVGAQTWWWLDGGVQLGEQNNRDTQQRRCVSVGRSTR